MFISTAITKIIEGDEVILIKDYNLDHGIITKGHVFKVIEKLNDSYKITDGNIILILNDSIIRKNLNISESENTFKINKEHLKLLTLIQKNCKYKDYNYCDYDRYDSCKLKNSKISGYYNDQCTPTDDCINYCNFKISRYFKIKNIKENKKFKKY